MRFAPSMLLPLGLLTVFSGVPKGQEIPRSEYLRFVSLNYPTLGQRNTATETLHLYGDPADPEYRDVDPLDGIDDRRHDILMKLAVRFAPYLIQNTSQFPVSFDAYINNAHVFPLHIDTWDISSQEAVLVEAEEINFSVLGQAVCPPNSLGRSQKDQLLSTTDGALEDCKLLRLLGRFHPSQPEDARLVQPLVRQRPDLFTVLFFDFPGDGPKSWDVAYQAEYEKTPERRQASFPYSYVHPFIEPVVSHDGEVQGYELALQYWFFYPSNDGGNNHEGDWEHLNVLIAPLSAVDRPLSVETIGRILTGELSTLDDVEDPLVIRRIDYYFHHFVMTLDLTAPNVYQPRGDWKKDAASQPEVRIEEHEIWEDIRRMAYTDESETIVNTHPFAYIGADNKGLDQAMAAPGGRNRNSHGTFPFPGRYYSIGPAGATEQVSVHLDPRRYWRHLESGKSSTGPSFTRGAVLGLADPDRLRIVPDWERVIDLTREDPGARRDWSWLVLPIRWGYPATESPFAGIVPHTDTGNLAPVGPSFSSGWNASGPAPGFHSYEPHTLPSLFPLGFQDSFRNDLGFLNLTLPLFFNLPPLDFLTRILSYPFKSIAGHRDPVYYPKDNVPYRFVGLSGGVSRQVFDEDFNALALNPGHYDEFILRPILHILQNAPDTTTAVTGGSQYKTNAVGPAFRIEFYIGKRFVTENMVRNARSSFGLRLDFNNIPSYTYDAEINYWEYAGSIRYGLTSTRLQPYVKAGYGWGWYRLENVQANGELFDPANSEWIKPGFWPNIWHVGLGLEYVPWRRGGRLPGGAELAFRFEFARYQHALGLDLSSISLERLDLLFDTLGDVPGSDHVSRDDLSFGVTVSF